MKVDKIIFDYEPGYFSSSINLENINIAIDRNNIKYNEYYFDGDEDYQIESHLSHFNKSIKEDDFNNLAKLVEELLDIENDYEYYDSEITNITIYYDDGSYHKVEVYCNLNKNDRLIPLVKYLEKLLTKEYLLPSMQYVD